MLGDAVVGLWAGQQKPQTEHDTTLVKAVRKDTEISVHTRIYSPK